MLTANVAQPPTTTRAASPVLSNHTIIEKCGNARAVTTLATMNAIGMVETDAGPVMRRYSTSERRTVCTGPANHPSRNAWASLTAVVFLAWYHPAAAIPTIRTTPAVPEVTVNTFQKDFLGSTTRNS